MKRAIKIIFGAVCALVICILAAGAVGYVCWPSNTFTETFYTMYSNKIEEPVRAILLSDLHQVAFGQNNDGLVSRIEELKPDVILMAGDIINKEGTNIDYAVDLCQRLVKIAPVYYGLGNHENEVVYGNDLDIEFLEQQDLQGNPEDFTPIIQQGELLERLADAGVVVVQNQAVTGQIKGNEIVIGGVSTNLSSFWPHSGQFIYSFAEENKDRFKILISHRPDPVMEYIADYNVDLTVSGHNHGGIIRIPGIGGLISEDEGLFPKYDGGKIETGRMTTIISRGLGGHGIVPRIFNQPELVIVDIN